MTNEIHFFVDDFADPEFIKLNQWYFDQYVKLRVHGYEQKDAFIRVFGADNLPGILSEAQRRLDDIERTTYFHIKFQEILKNTKPSEFWNPNLAIHNLLSIARSIYSKDGTRLAAIKELNVLCEITVVDENGKTKAGRSLADFYRAQQPEVKKEPQEGGAAPQNDSTATVDQPQQQ